MWRVGPYSNANVNYGERCVLRGSESLARLRLTVWWIVARRVAETLMDSQLSTSLNAEGCIVTWKITWLGGKGFRVRCRGVQAVQAPATVF